MNQRKIINIFFGKDKIDNDVKFLAFQPLFSQGSFQQALYAHQLIFEHINIVIPLKTIDYFSLIHNIIYYE